MGSISLLIADDLGATVLIKLVVGIFAGGLSVNWSKSLEYQPMLKMTVQVKSKLFFLLL